MEPINSNEKIIKKVEEYINQIDYNDCPICLEKINIDDLFIFSCGHFFCKDCKKKYNSLKCHSCRVIIKYIKIVDLYNYIKDYTKYNIKINLRLERTRREIIIQYKTLNGEINTILIYVNILFSKNKNKIFNKIYEEKLKNNFYDYINNKAYMNGEFLVLISIDHLNLINPEDDDINSHKILLYEDDKYIIFLFRCFAEESIYSYTLNMSLKI